MVNKKIIIYTDGSSLGNPGVGGWGAIVLFTNGQVVELGGAEENTTNNRMEMTAVIEALYFVIRSQNLDTLYLNKVVLYTDSSYTINGITKWVFGWQKNNWIKKDKKEVLNKDLWKRLLELTKDLSIEWRYVAGHSGVEGNDRVDKIAISFASGKKINLYEGGYDKYGIDLLDISYDENKKTTRNISKARSKVKAYSYLSLVDGVFKKHKTWAECEKCVKGKSGAMFKKALSIDDEKEIMRKWKI